MKRWDKIYNIFPLLFSYTFINHHLFWFSLWIYFEFMGVGNLVQYWSVVFITDMDWSEIKIVPVWVLKFPQHWSHSAWSTADKWLGEAINHPNIEDQGSRALTFSPSKHHWALWLYTFKSWISWILTKTKKRTNTQNSWIFWKNRLLGVFVTKCPHLKTTQFYVHWKWYWNSSNKTFFLFTARKNILGHKV